MLRSSACELASLLVRLGFYPRPEVCVGFAFDPWALVLYGHVRRQAKVLEQEDDGGERQGAVKEARLGSCWMPRNLPSWSGSHLSQRRASEGVSKVDDGHVLERKERRETKASQL